MKAAVIMGSASDEAKVGKRNCYIKRIWRRCWEVHIAHRTS